MATGQLVIICWKNTYDNIVTYEPSIRDRPYREDPGHLSTGQIRSNERRALSDDNMARLLRLGRPHGENHHATRPQPHGFDRQRRGNGKCRRGLRAMAALSTPGRRSTTPTLHICHYNMAGGAAGQVNCRAPPESLRRPAKKRHPDQIYIRPAMRKSHGSLG